MSDKRDIYEQDRVYVIQKIQRGIDRTKDEGTLTQKEVEGGLGILGTMILHGGLSICENT